MPRCWRSCNGAVLEIMQRLLLRGVAEGVFRHGIDPVHPHPLIASFCFYRVSNRLIWKIIFKRDLEDAANAIRQRAMVVDAVPRYLRPDEPHAG